VSHQEIVLVPGTVVVALKGAYQAKGNYRLAFQECEQVIIRGAKKDRGKLAGIRMHKEDYPSAAYEKSEWRHGLAFLGCQDVRVQELRIEKTGGDGIYLGATPEKTANRSVVVKDDIDRSFFKVRVRNSNGVKDITGNITLVRKGQRERNQINEGWLEKARLAAEQPTAASGG